MAKFINRILNALGQIYQFQGGQAYVDEVDLSRPVTLVHDVSREAELGSGVGKAEGFATVIASAVHGAGGSINTGFNVATVAAAQCGYDVGRHDLWLLGIGGFISATGIFTSGRAWVVNNPENGVPGQGFRLIYVWTGQVDDGGAVQTFSALPVYTAYEFLPALLFYEGTGTLYITSTVAAAGTVNWYVHLWIGAKGTRPPGVA